MSTYRGHSALVVAIVAAGLLLYGCQSSGPAPSDDTCVPPTPSTAGAPWKEADDGDPCVLTGDGQWVNAGEGGHLIIIPRATMRPARSSTRPPSPTKNTKRTKPRPRRTS